jgi:hypothetical protein
MVPIAQQWSLTQIPKLPVAWFAASKAADMKLSPSECNSVKLLFSIEVGPAIDFEPHDIDIYPLLTELLSGDTVNRTV